MIQLIITLAILGLVAWLVGIAPMIDATFKTFINYALIVVGAVVLIVWVLNYAGIQTLL